MSDISIIIRRTGEATCKSALQVRSEGATVKDYLTVQAEGLRPASRTITVNERPLLNVNGRISYDAMKRLADDREDTFDQQRKLQDAIVADATDMEEPKAIEAKVKTRKESGQ